MQSIRNLYRIGKGPSSSHTIGPHRAAQNYMERWPDAESFRATLYGSLAATGKGHMTDLAILEAMAPKFVEIIWKPEQFLPFHPNGMTFEALDKSNYSLNSWTIFSVGGGEIREEKEQAPSASITYPLSSMSNILDLCDKSGQNLWEYVEEVEGKDIYKYLRLIWLNMCVSVKRGLSHSGMLPGGLGLARKAKSFHRKAKMLTEYSRKTALVSSYALAVSEENAFGGVIVTAPTCGSAGVVPAVLFYLQDTISECDEDTILQALATAGLLGNLVKLNASISGAEVGCQGEIGTACVMAAGAATQVLGGSPRQIEYAAEMAMEHHLGLTCDPIGGLVQIPCIERNVFAATQALTCADYALCSDGIHRIPFDEVIQVMKQTGKDIPYTYRETALGGLAAAYRRR